MRCCGAYDAPSGCAGVLDYDDLVLDARDLLRRPGIAPWVLFKLDGGLDHILIDEAQDTNPEQWEIVAALAEEFFAGEGAARPQPHVFAVGDAKQSIYSFQRADPQAFLRMRAAFRRNGSIDAQQDWRIVPLDISFRSTEPVLRGGRCDLSPAAGAGRRRARRRRDPPSRARAGQAGTRRAVAAGRPAAAGRAGRRGSCRSRTRRVAEPRARLARAIAATIGIGSTPASGWRRATGRSGPATSWCWCAGAAPSSANWCAR